MRDSLPEPDYRAPPHNIEVEQALLGATLMDNTVVDRLQHLRAEEFFDPLHGAIWTAINAYRNDRRVANAVTLRNTFETTPPVGELSVPQYLGKLTASAVTTSGAASYATTIVDLAARRRMILVGEDIAAAAYSTVTDVASASIEAVLQLDDVLASTRQRQVTRASIAATAETVLREIEERRNTATLPTGLGSLDGLTGGYRRGELIVLAARPSMGKSCWSGSTMLGIARKGHGVLLFSLEMTSEATTLRCLSDLTWRHDGPIPYSRLLKRELRPGELPRLREASQSFTGMPLAIDDAASLTVAEIAARCRQQARAFERDGLTLDVIIVDHLGLVRASDRYAGQRHREIAEITEGLKALGKQLGCAVIALHQLNRNVEKQDNKRPGLSDLRDSGSVEENADVVMFLYRPAYYLERAREDKPDDEADRLAALARSKNDLELIMAKQRNGPCTPIQLFCEMSCNVVRDREVRHG